LYRHRVRKRAAFSAKAKLPHEADRINATARRGQTFVKALSESAGALTPAKAETLSQRASYLSSNAVRDMSLKRTAQGFFSKNKKMFHSR